MNADLKKLIKMLNRLGNLVVEIYSELEENRKIMETAVKLQMLGVKDAPEVHLIDGSFHSYKIETYDLSVDKGRINFPKDSKVWLQVKRHQIYKPIQNFMQERKTGDRFETIIREYVYDVISNVATKTDEQPKKKVKVEIAKRSKKLAENLLLSYPNHCLLSPIYSAESDRNSVKLGEYATIRPASYSETLEYSLGFSNLTGQSDFTHVIEINQKSLAKGRFYDNIHPNLALLTSIITALRLVYGGGVGTRFAHYWIMMDMTKQKIGSLHQLGDSEILPSRALRPGREITKVKYSEISKVVNLIELLIPLQLSVSHKLNRALTRFGQAVESGNLVDRIIESIIGLECLFGGFTKTVVKSVVAMLSTNKESETRLKSIIESCYMSRNKLIHGSSIENAEKAAKGNLKVKSKQLVEILRSCLILSLNYSPLDWKELKERTISKEMT